MAAKSKVSKYPPKSEELAQLLSVGYGGMTEEKARAIIEERRKDPRLWPYEKYEEAEAFLAALEASPQVISKRPGWKRIKNV